MLPILFQFGSFTIYSYGFFLTLAYLASTFVLWREGKKRGFNEEKLLDLSLLTLIASLIGARLLYALLNWDYFAGDPKTILFVWQGGFAYFGSLICGLAVVWYFCKKWKWPFFQIADIGALAVSLGFIVGKIGAFLAGTDYGNQTSLPWGVTFTNLVGSRHPVQLYEAFAMLLIFWFLSRLYLKNIGRAPEIRSGEVFFVWLILSGASRFIFEFFRADSSYIAGVKLPQILALMVATAGVVGLYYFNLRNFRLDMRILVKKISSLDFKVASSKIIRR